MPRPLAGHACGPKSRPSAIFRPRAAPYSLEVGRRATLRSWPHFPTPARRVQQPDAAWRDGGVVLAEPPPPKRDIPGALATATVRRPLRACAQGMRQQSAQLEGGPASCSTMPTLAARLRPVGFSALPYRSRRSWRSVADRRMETADGHALLAGRCNRISRSLGCGSVFRGVKLATKSRGCSGENV